jgi:hypothetical protein
MLGLRTLPWLVLLVAAVALHGPVAARAAPPAQDGCAQPPADVEQAVVGAASAYMRGQYPDIFDRAVVRRVEGDWARVRVLTRVETEPTSLILHREGSAWSVVQGPSATASLSWLPGSTIAVYYPCSSLTALGALTENGLFAVGAAARIRNTLGDGLPVRANPSPGAAAQALLPNGAAVTIVQGPVLGADYYWYAVRYDGDGNSGWVAELFLAPAGDGATPPTAPPPAARPVPTPAAAAAPQRSEVTITLDRGPGATYRVGDAIRMCLAVNQPSLVRLTYRVAASGTTDAWEGLIGEGQIADRWCSETVLSQALGRETLRADVLGADGQVVATDAVSYLSQQ